MSYTYILSAWIASLAFGIETITGKLTSKYSISNPWLFSLAWLLFSLILTTPISLYFGAGIPGNWLWIVVNGLTIALVNVFLVLAMFSLDVTIFSPLFNFRTVFAVILAAVFFKEVLSGWQYLLIALIVIGGIFASVDEKAKISNFFSKKILLGLACMFMLAISSLTTKQSILENGYWTSSLWSSVAGLMFLLPTFLLCRKDIKSTLIKNYLGVGIMTIIGSIGTMTANYAYLGNVTISTAIISLPISMIITIALSRINPKLLEKHTLKVYTIRLIAACVMIYCAYRLNI